MLPQYDREPDLLGRIQREIIGWKQEEQVLDDVEVGGPANLDPRAVLSLRHAQPLVLRYQSLGEREYESRFHFPEPNHVSRSFRKISTNSSK